jgi:hypothetical protein
VISLSCHWAEPAHLPEQPLIDIDPPALIGGIEFAGLETEILQNCAGFEYGDRLAASPSGSTMTGMRLLSEIARNSGWNCSPLLMLIEITV